MSIDIEDFLKAVPVTVEDFFKSKQLFEVPPYQREYSWKAREQVSSLIDDILDRDSEATYFIGSVILLKNENTHLEIVDGQQRSTTISLMYTSLYYLSQYLFKIVEKFNSDELKAELNILISEIKKTMFYENNHILTLSEQKNNKNDYIKALSYIPNLNDNLSKLLDENKMELDKRRRLYNNFIFIFSQIRAKILNNFLNLLKEKRSDIYLNNISLKWVEELERKIFLYIISGNFSELNICIKSLLKNGIDKNDINFNQYIGSLHNDILSLIKEINLEDKALKDIARTLEKFDSLSNEEIASSCSAVLGKAPMEILSELNSHPNLKKLTKIEVQDKQKEIQDANNQIIKDNITPVIREFIIFYIKQIQHIKSKIDKTAIVKMTVENPSSANNLFETINHRGLPLSAMDLIKNDILRSISQEDQLRGSNNLTEAIDKWNELIENIKSTDDQIRFLRHYYIVNYCSTENFKIPTKSNIVDLYKYMLNKFDNKKDIFDDLISKSQIYLFMTNFEKIDNEYKFNKFGSEIKKIFLELNRVNCKPSLTIFMWLLQNNHLNIIHPVYEVIKKFFIMRHITNYPEVKYLDSIFKEVIEKFNNESNYYNVLNEKLSLKIPSLELIKEKLEGPLYYDNSEITRYLLIEINNVLSLASEKENINLWSKNENNDYDFTIEHIIPQNEAIQDNWDNIKLNILSWKNSLLNRDISTTTFTEEEKSNIKNRHIQILNSLGNLTMTAYNSNLSDNTFLDKRDKKNNNNDYIGFKNQILLNSSLKFNVNNNTLSLENCDYFGYNEVISRNKAISELIIKNILRII